MPLAKNNYYSPNGGFIHRSEFPSRYGGKVVNAWVRVVGIGIMGKGA